MRKDERTRLLKGLLSGLLRPQRECSIGMYLLLLELYADGELSSLALERRLKQAGLQNPRQYVHGAASNGWVRCIEHDDGKSWRLTATGNAVLAGVLRRLVCTRAVKRASGEPVPDGQLWLNLE